MQNDQRVKDSLTDDDWETFCEICGVNLHIGRLRRVDEPKESRMGHRRRSLCRSIKVRIR